MPQNTTPHGGLGTPRPARPAFPGPARPVSSSTAGRHLLESLRQLHPDDPAGSPGVSMEFPEENGMPISIVVPQLGESVAEGTVSKWLKQVGDRVRKEEPLVEIQTDKINVEIPSPSDGTLQSITVAEGTTVLVGTEIGVLSGAGEEAGVAKPAAASKPAAAAAPAQASAPPPPARAASTAVATPPSPAAAPLPSGSNGHGVNDRNLSPAVRKIMRDENVSAQEIASIPGSGIAGRVTRDDLLEYLKRRTQRPSGVPAAPMPAAAAAPLPSYMRASMAPAAGGPRTDVVPFTKVRKLIAENMVRAKHTAAHTHCFDEADMGALVALRKEWGPKLEAQGVKLTYMPFFIKAVVFALKEFPWVNGEVKDDTLVVKHYYNIGMAVGRDEKGLIVVNIKDCDRKNLVQ